MGKGEWCVWGSCAQLPKESNEESNDALGQRELGLAATVAQKIQVPGDFKLAVKLRRGAKGDAETTNELKRRAEGVSFNHIRALPGLKGCKLLHGTNMVVLPHSHDIVFVRAGAKKRISVIPFPFPHSPFPGV